MQIPRQTMKSGTQAPHGNCIVGDAYVDKGEYVRLKLRMGYRGPRWLGEDFICSNLRGSKSSGCSSCC
jgi:hypothetical protein